jgi:hypothetical protein
MESLALVLLPSRWLDSVAQGKYPSSKMIPPARATDDLCGASVVVDTNALVDFYSCHSIVREWKREPRDAGRLATRCTRARDALLLAITFDKASAHTYCLAYEPMDKFVDFAPPSSDDLPSAFMRTSHLYVHAHLLNGWVIVTPDDGGPARFNSFNAAGGCS